MRYFSAVKILFWIKAKLEDFLSSEYNIWSQKIFVWTWKPWEFVESKDVLFQFLEIKLKKEKFKLGWENASRIIKNWISLDLNFSEPLF
jgi:hypothetical protein